MTRVAGGSLAEKFGGEYMAAHLLHHRADRRGVADRGDRLPDQRRGRAADRPRHGPGQRRGVQDGAEICAARGRRRIRPGRRVWRAGRLRDPAGAGPVRRRAGRHRLFRRVLLLRRAGRRGDHGLHRLHPHPQSVPIAHREGNAADEPFPRSADILSQERRYLLRRPRRGDQRRPRTGRTATARAGSTTRSCAPPTA